LPTHGRRKLLLADDSPTVQKVVSLTFDDEGFQVIAVGTGEQALAELERDVPDIVLADVHMPAPDGYELCARIKRDERTRRVPVMLLVGAFEPFDEAEARRVGADEVLTKPFQSIRELVNKVGGLLGGQPDVKKAHEAADEDEQTGELRTVASDEAHAAEAVSEAQIVAASTDVASANVADARPAFADLGMDDMDIETMPAEEFTGRDTAPPQMNARAEQSFAASAAAADAAPHAYSQTFDARTAASAAADDALLELGDIDAPRSRTSAARGDFVLDFDDEETYAPPQAEFDAPAYAEGAQVYTEDAPSALEMQAAGSMSMAEPTAGWVAPEEFTVSPEAVTEPVVAPAQESDAHVSSFDDATAHDEALSVNEPVALSESVSHGAADDDASMTNDASTSETQASTVPAQAGAVQLSPETIDAIARRVVEHLSDHVVREIAWEVVPDLAERLIRRKLAEEQTRAQ
jgi:CheY-like chemotaxis protein